MPPLSKCGIALLCYARSAPLWILVVVLFVLAALRHRLVAASKKVSPSN